MAQERSSSHTIINLKPAFVHDISHLLGRRRFYPFIRVVAPVPQRHLRPRNQRPQGSSETVFTKHQSGPGHPFKRLRTEADSKFAWESASNYWLYSHYQNQMEVFLNRHPVPNRPLSTLPRVTLPRRLDAQSMRQRCRRRTTIPWSPSRTFPVGRTLRSWRR